MANKPNKSTNKTEPQGGKKPAKDTAKDKSKDKGKVSLITRLKNFFRGLKNELKLVVWPDKKSVKQTTAVVLVIVALTAVLIFIVDSVMTGVLSLAGFNVAPVSQTTTTTTTPPASETTIGTTVTETSANTGITTIPGTEAQVTTSAGN